MPVIGVISDTHGLLRPEAVAALEGSEIILHAGDVGDLAILDALGRIAPVYAVYGNTDYGAVRSGLPRSVVVDLLAGIMLTLGAVTTLASLLFGYAELPVSQRSLSSRDATRMWIELGRSRPGEITGLVTGPLTNLALAIRRDPELPRLLNRLVLMGGAFQHQGNTTPTSEWNIAVDPEAAAEVFAAFSGLPPLSLMISLI